MACLDVGQGLWGPPPRIKNSARLPETSTCCLLIPELMLRHWRIEWKYGCCGYANLSPRNGPVSGKVGGRDTGGYRPIVADSGRIVLTFRMQGAYFFRNKRVQRRESYLWSQF